MFNKIFIILKNIFLRICMFFNNARYSIAFNILAVLGWLYVFIVSSEENTLYFITNFNNIYGGGLGFLILLFWHYIVLSVCIIFSFIISLFEKIFKFKIPNNKFFENKLFIFLQFIGGLIIIIPFISISILGLWFMNNMLIELIEDNIRLFYIIFYFVFLFFVTLFVFSCVKKLK